MIQGVQKNYLARLGQTYRLIIGNHCFISGSGIGVAVAVGICVGVAVTVGDGISVSVAVGDGVGIGTTTPSQPGTRKVPIRVRQLMGDVLA